MRRKDRNPKHRNETQRVKPDRRKRKMRIVTQLGMAPITVPGSTQASQLGRYMSAVGQFLKSGKTEALEDFEGKVIAGHPLITDPDTLSSLAQAGALELDQIYALPESSS